jgi:hypothetical protein
LRVIGSTATTGRTVDDIAMTFRGARCVLISRAWKCDVRFLDTWCNRNAVNEMHSIDRKPEPTMRTAKALVFEQASLAESSQRGRRRRGRYAEMLCHPTRTRGRERATISHLGIQHDILEDGPRRHADAPA